MQIDPTSIERRLRTPVSGDIGTRRSRRWKVVALYGSYIIFCAAAAVQALPHSLWIRVAGLVLYAIALLAAAYGLMSLLGRTFVNAPNIRESALDERQRERRNDAIARSLPAIGLVLAICLGYLELSAALGPGFYQVTVVEALVWAAFLLSMSLPSAIIAWTEPDPFPAEVSPHCDLP